MKHFDFRWFLEDLDKRGELFRVPIEVDTLDEMGAFIARADYEDIHKPILFEKPTGFDIQVLANTVGHTYRRMADAFGVPCPSCGFSRNAGIKDRSASSPFRITSLHGAFFAST